MHNLAAGKSQHVKRIQFSAIISFAVSRVKWGRGGGRKRWYFEFTLYILTDL
jgi:hypothetical protein